MKKTVLFLTLFAAACGGAGDTGSESNEAGANSQSLAVSGGGTGAEMPFGLPAAPDARLLGKVERAAGGEGKETAVASFATHSSPEKVVAFYKPVLEQAGFNVLGPILKTDAAVVVGTRDKDSVSITARKGSKNVAAGEVEIKIAGLYHK